MKKMEISLVNFRDEDAKIELSFAISDDKFLEHFSGIYLEGNKREAFKLPGKWRVEDSKLKVMIEHFYLDMLIKKKDLMSNFKVKVGLRLDNDEFLVSIENKLTSKIVYKKYLVVDETKKVLTIHNDEVINELLLEINSVENLGKIYKSTIQKVDQINQNAFLIHGGIENSLEDIEILGARLVQKHFGQVINLPLKITESNKFELFLDLNCMEIEPGTWDIVIDVKNQQDTLCLRCFSDELWVDLNFELKKYPWKIVQVGIIKEQEKYIALCVKETDAPIKANLTYLKNNDNCLEFKGNILTYHHLSVIDSVHLVFRNRRNQIEKYFSDVVLYKSIKKFSGIIYFDKTDLIEMDGIWDLYLELNAGREFKRIRLQYSEEEVTEHHEVHHDRRPLFVPQTVFNSNVIKRLRPYITDDKHWSVIIRNNAFQCHIDKLIYVSDMAVIEGYLQISGLSEINVEEIFIENTKGVRVFRPRFEIFKDDKTRYFKIVIDDLSSFARAIGMNDSSLKIAIKFKDYSYLFDLQSNVNDIYNKSYSVICPPYYVSEIVHIQPYYNDNNILCFGVRSKVAVYCNKVRFTKNKLHIDCLFKSEKSNIDIENPKLVLRSVDQKKEIASIESFRCDSNKFSFVLDLLSLDLADLVLSVFVQFSINGYPIEQNLLGKTKRKKTKIKLSSIRNSEEKGRYIYYWGDEKNGTLKIENRNLKEWEKYSSKLKFEIMRIAGKLASKFIKRKVWLVGENLGYVAQDNGFAFFEYCMNNRKNEKILYVSRKDNVNFKNLMPYKKNVLVYNSWKHMFFYHLAEFLIFSHGIRDVIPDVIHNKISQNPKKVIYLQHGVIAMKKLYFNKNSYNGKIVKFIVSSDREKKILTNNMGFLDSQVCVTGLARFDKLLKASYENCKNEILIMPTWRDWVIKNKDDFLKSEFYRRYSSLLCNPRLLALLKKYGLVLKFYPHIEIQKKYIEYFQSNHDCVTIVDMKKESVQELIQTSKLMITDYSSVAFDFCYLKKPVIFYQFDLNDYLEHRGSYIDMREHLFGPVVKTEEELIGYVEYVIENNFRIDDKYMNKSKLFFKFTDQKNSERIYNEIKKIQQQER